MGVTGLWTVVAPTARPTQLATLNRKRLAVDASIWIYQFLKAVRDKEGNALRNSHVVGFFRRICKLLYFGIKPVFVFDGGAPILKRETVRARARKREGRREDAARTAGKLLALQVARAAEEEDKRRRAERERTPLEEELPPEQDLVYVDEIGMDPRERQAGRGFRRKDQYHLPDLDVSIESMGAPNDPRIMSQAELEEYARQFHRGEDINLYDFSKIDFEGPFFMSLPAGDRYNILNAARLRSRLRMGYSKEQLDGMFPDRMAFSKFQIERVKERNELTQRLMHLNEDPENFLDQGGRIAGEKGREYVLVKNDGVDGGWALGVVSNKHGAKREDAINVDEEENSDGEKELSEEEEDFEDVEIEGLNRIPKIWKNKHREVDYDTNYETAVEQIARKRKEIYEARAQNIQKRPARPAPAPKPYPGDTDALFVQQDVTTDHEMDELFEDVDLEQPIQEEGDDELQRAIAMSLQPHSQAVSEAGGFLQEEDAQRDTRPDLDEEMDLATALAESRRSKFQSSSRVREKSPPESKRRFDGPLPFESLNLGQSLLGKKKSKRVDEALSGGFDKNLGEDAFRKERPAQPIPSWFNAAPKTNDLVHRPVDENEDEFDQSTYGGDFESRRETLRRHETKDIIDLDAEPIAEEVASLDGSDIGAFEPPQQDESNDMVEADEPADEPQTNPAEAVRKEKEERERNERYRLAQEIADENAEKEDVQFDAVADHSQASRWKPSITPEFIPQQSSATEPPKSIAPDDEEMVDWSESDIEAGSPWVTASDLPADNAPAGGPLRVASGEPTTNVHDEEESDDEFEDVPPPSATTQPALLHQETTFDVEDALNSNFLLAEAEGDRTNPNGNGGQYDPTQQDEEQYFSDSEEELMRQLAVEAEEHARFALSLNNKTPAEVARDYENELKQLRNQQKKDRRDADEVTQVMVQECQALLRLFGLPYITAPMEAEAQCAELVHLGLVDGIVTDDSDIFLFGGTRIYKNLFNAAKFVECYLSADLEKEYALDRRKLIRFAHLLGSDYTEGIPGVGPVSALEILTEFPTLEEFREWCSKVQLGRPKDLENQLTTPFRRKFRNTVQKRLFLPPGFPDVRVDQAYLKPEVDSDPQEFQWGVPDLDKLRGFLMATIGWSQERTDEILVPVIRDMNKRGAEGTQANITRFFAGGVGVGAADGGNAPRNRTGKESGRMANAFKRLRGEAEKNRRGDGEEIAGRSEELMEEATSGDVDRVEQGKGKWRGKKRQPASTPDDGAEDGEDESDARVKKAPAKRRKKKGKNTEA